MTWLGGLFAVPDALLLEPFLARIRATFPAADLMPAAGDALAGAARLATPGARGPWPAWCSTRRAARPDPGVRLMRRALLLVLAVALLPGCGALTPSAGGSSAKGPLQVWIMEPGNPELRAFFTSATAEFEAAHPGDRVAVQFVPWASAHDQFVTAIGGGQMPDVAEMGSTWTPEFGDIGALEPAELGGEGDGGPVRAAASSRAPPSTARSTASPGTPGPGR